jgi:uncharacterized protein (DUF1499 family)
MRLARRIFDMETMAAVALLGMTLVLQDCPDSPNCVSSQASDPQKLVEPFDYQGRKLASAKEALLKALASLPRIEIVSQEGSSLKATATSAVFGFVDELDFIFDDEKKLIHVRSASRTGYWDLGVNASRVEKLRKAFQEALKSHGIST